MNKQVLSAEQMQELIELGIDVSKASMYWVESFYFDEKNNNKRIIMQSVSLIPTTDAIPTFTLQDILEMLPDYYWIEKFSNIYKIKDVDGDTYFESKSLLEAAFNMLKWCKQNIEI